MPKAVILPAGRPASCEPITATRDLGDCLVANQRFADMQRLEVERAGFTVVPKAELDPDTCVINGHAFVTAEDLLAMLKADELQLDDIHGRTLCYRQPQSACCGITAMTASKDSIAVKYAWDLLEVNRVILSRVTESAFLGHVHPRTEVDGVLLVDEGTRVLPGVYVEGTVVIGRNCKIGPNCYLRGPTAIGDHCHIGQAVEVKASIIMPHSSIGHLSYTGDSVIGERVNFGAGTITATLRHDGTNHRSAIAGELVDSGRRKLGTIIGDDVHTGIHTSIYPGRKFWPHTSTRPGDTVNKDLT